MTDANLFGRAVSLGQIERRLTAHCRLWFPSYLRNAEREEGVKADGVTPHQVGTLPLPKAWEATQGRVDKWPAAQLPAVVFGSPGLDGDGLRRDGRGNHAGAFVFAFSAVTSGRDDRSTRWLCGVYTAALRLLFIQQPDVEGLPVESCAYEDESYDDLPYSRTGALMSGTVSFTLGLGGLGSARSGPMAPLPEPSTDPGPHPVVTETSLEMERRPVAD